VTDWAKGTLRKWRSRSNL